MICNLTRVERGVRVLIGCAILAVAWGSGPAFRWIAFLAIIPFATAFLCYCPLYQLMGYNPRARSGQ